ncbi:hypothetical protein JHK87_000618 [Glycine soja]|nr:hypothetical protein JHK87_000618 [Glycine soja]
MTEAKMLTTTSKGCSSSRHDHRQRNLLCRDVKNRSPIIFGSRSRPGLQAGSEFSCTGIWVFLPCQYGAPPPDSRKKTGCATPVLVPAKVIHALNLNIDELNVVGQPCFSSFFGVDYDALLARRNALLLLQKLSMWREEAENFEALRLPQEWTYKLLR